MKIKEGDRVYVKWPTGVKDGPYRVNSASENTYYISPEEEEGEYWAVPKDKCELADWDEPHFVKCMKWISTCNDEYDEYEEEYDYIGIPSLAGFELLRVVADSVTEEFVDRMGAGYSYARDFQYEDKILPLVDMPSDQVYKVYKRYKNKAEHYGKIAEEIKEGAYRHNGIREVFKEKGVDQYGSAI